jgi:heavy metal sensor kinase
MRRSIRLRLTLWNASVVALVTGSFAIAGWFTLTRVLRDRAETTARETARAIAGALLAERRALAARGEVEEERGATEAAVLQELRVGALDIFITDEATEVMAASITSREAVAIPASVRAFMRQVAGERASGAVADSTVVVRGVQLESGPARAAVLRLAPDVNDRWEEPALLVTAVYSEAGDRLLLGQVRTILLLALPLALLMSGLAGYLLARRSLAPLEAMTARTASISAATLDDRLPVVNPHDELGRLAQIINGLIGRVEAAFRTQRQFVADASHELRTPLAIIRGEADVTLRRSTRSEAEYREAMTVIQGESVRLTRIVEDLFLLARVDAAGPSLRRAPVPLPPVVRDVVHAIRSVAETRGVRVELRLGADDQPVVAGDESLLRRLLLNLVDNAIRHARAQGLVTITLSTHGEWARLVVQDDGPGVPSALRDRLFDRFVHGPRPVSPSGTLPADGATGGGLGLAIAQAIADAHGGRIALLDSEPGATFAVDLPLLPSPGVST